MFQNLRQGSTLYVIERSDIPVLKLGQVISVGSPTPVYNPQTSGVTLGFQPTMEVIIRAKVDDKEGDFAHLPATSGVHDYGNMIVTDSREGALSEIDNISRAAQQRLDSHGKDEKTVAACKDMFKTLNPNYAKEVERDEAITSLSDRLDGIESSISQILKTLNKK